MPGIIVACEGGGHPDLARRAARMAEASRSAAGQHLTLEAIEPGRLFLGRLDLGLLEPGEQPFHCADGRYVGVLTGELLDRPALARALGLAEAPLSSADLLVAAWKAGGWAALARLTGSFFFALYDGAVDTLYVGGDRHGSRPHAFSLEGERLLLAPEVRAVVAGSTGTHEADIRAVFECLAFEHPLADRTLLEGVRIFPPGTVLVLGPGGPRWHPWWTPRYRPDPAASLREVLPAAITAYAGAVQRHAVGPHALSLSGGLDSRTVLAFLPPDTRTFAFGSPDSDDVRLAQRVAAARQHAFRVLPLTDDYMVRNAPAMIRRGEGMVSLFHAHDADGLEAVAGIAPTALLGMTAEFARGEFAENVLAASADGAWREFGLLIRHLAAGRRPWDVPGSEDALVGRLLQRTWVALTPELARVALRPPAFAAMGAWLDRAVRMALAEIEGQPADRLATYNLLHRQRRFTTWGVKIAGAVHEVRRPLDDPALVSLLLGLPHDVRRRLQAAVIRQVAPELAAIPLTGTGVPLSAGPLARAWTLGRRRLTARGGRRQSFADPQALLRTTARPLFEQVLLGPRLSENRLLDPAGVRRLVEAHMAGRQDLAAALSALATLELWRQEEFAGEVLPVPA